MPSFEGIGATNPISI